MITQEILAILLPGLPEDKRQSYAPLLQSAMSEFGINTALREAAFIAQITHESGGLKLFVENLNYSAAGLNKVFRKYFPTLESALPFHRKPEKIANRVYANRMSNGPESSGDGFRFRGRGAIQLTGRDNYTRFGQVLELDLVGNPDLAATPEVAFRTAGAFWKSKGCNELADQQNIREITRRINGGFIGLAERMALFAKTLEVLNSQGQTRGAATTRGARSISVERDVPPDLSRGIYPGIHLVEKAAPKSPAVKPKAAAKKAVKKPVKKAAPKATAKAGTKKAVKKTVAKAAPKKAVKSRAAAPARKTAAKKVVARKAPAKKSGRK